MPSILEGTCLLSSSSLIFTAPDMHRRKGFPWDHTSAVSQSCPLKFPRGESDYWEGPGGIPGPRVTGARPPSGAGCDWVLKATPLFWAGPGARAVELVVAGPTRSAPAAWFFSPRHGSTAFAGSLLGLLFDHRELFLPLPCGEFGDLKEGRGKRIKILGMGCLSP